MGAGSSLGGDATATGTTERQKLGEPRVATSADNARLDICYGYRDTDNMVTLYKGSKRTALSSRPIAELGHKIRANMGFTLPIQLYAETDKAKQYPIIFDVSRCSK